MFKSLFLNFAIWLLLPGLKSSQRTKNKGRPLHGSSPTASAGVCAERSGCDRSGKGGCDEK